MPPFSSETRAEHARTERHRAPQASPRASRAATRALRSSQTSVIGPTPPGTGETASTSGSTDSVSTSPTSRVAAVGPRHGVDADVDDDRALAHEAARDQPRHARGHDQQVGHPRVLRQPARVGGVLVRGDHGRVAREARGSPPACPRSSSGRPPRGRARRRPSPGRAPRTPCSGRACGTRPPPWRA